MATVNNLTPNSPGLQGIGTFAGGEAQHISITDALCEGPIWGLVDGAASIYLDNVSAEHARLVTYQPDIAGAGITFDGTTNVGIVDDGVTLPEDTGTGTRMITVEEYEQLNVLVGGITELADEGYSFSLSGTNLSATDHNTTYNPPTLERYATFIIALGNPFGQNFKVLSMAGDHVVNSSTTSTFITRENPFLMGSKEELDAAIAAGTVVSGTVYLTEKYQIEQVDPANNTVTVTGIPPAGSSPFSFTGVSNFNSLPGATGGTTNFDPNQAVGKLDNLYVQEVVGSIDQPPLAQVGNVGGSIALPGTIGALNVELNQIAPGNSEGLPVIDAFNPAEASKDGTPTIASGPNEFGAANFGLDTLARIKNADTISFDIVYNNGLNVYGGNDDITYHDCYAFYGCKITFKEDTGNNNFIDKHTVNVWPNYIVHKGRRTGPLLFTHIINIKKYREAYGTFDDFTVKIWRLTRQQGLPIGANGGNGGKSDRNKWTTMASSAVANLGSTIEDKLSYPYTAIISSAFNSRQFKETPKRSYDIRGKKVRIPTTYTPREYSSTGLAQYSDFWDGSFTNDVYTDNPAWIFYDLVTDRRYGAGKWIEESDVDIYNLYRISKYCDELVPGSGVQTANKWEALEFYEIQATGIFTAAEWNTMTATTNGTPAVGDIIRIVKPPTGVDPSLNPAKAIRYEPRFRMNLYLSRAEAVYKVLKDMASHFTSILYFMDAQVTLLQDSPQEPVYTFNKSNVINGKFTYESSPSKTRANQIIVQWNDPKSNYEIVPLVLEDPSNIVKVGKTITKEVVAFGCTHESQALRYARWKLWTGLNQTRSVNFETALQGIYIKPGDIVNIQDADRYGVMKSGRIGANLATTDTVIPLDRYVEFQAGHTYKISLMHALPGAIYVGYEDTVTIAGSSTYKKGEYIPEAYVKSGATYTLQDLDTEAKASNAFIDAAGTKPLSVVWKKYTHVDEYDIVNPGTGPYNSVTLNATLNHEVLAGSPWTLRQESFGINVLGSKKLYKVLSVKENAANLFGITAVEHYNEKFTAVDTDYDLGVIPPSIYEEQEPEVIPPPRNIAVLAEGTRIPDDGDYSKFSVTWDPPIRVDPNTQEVTPGTDFVAGYEVVAGPNLFPSGVYSTTTSETNISFVDVDYGNYVVRVRTVSPNKNYSEWVGVNIDYNDRQIGTQDIERIHGIPKWAYSNVTGGIKNSSTTYQSTDEFYNFNGTWHGIYNKTTDTFSVTQPTSDEFMVRQYAGPRRHRWIYIWAGEVIEELWLEPGGTPPTFERAGQTYELGSLQTSASSGPGTYNYYAIKGESTIGIEGSEVWTFDSFPAELSSYGNPGESVTITEASGNGVVDLSGIPDGDERELYILLDESVPKIFLGQFDRDSHAGVGPGIWRDIGDGSGGMDLAYELITGTAALTAQTQRLIGTGTLFTTEVAVGDKISLSNATSAANISSNGVSSAAKVLNVISDTELELDRSFPTGINLTRIYRNIYRPDYQKDAVIASIDRT